MPQAKVRDHREPGHFWADNEIVDEYLPAIGVYGFAVYMLLTKHADAKTGECDPSVTGMAKQLGISAPTVRAALDELEEQGLIRIKHRRREKNGKLINQTSLYTLLAVDKHQRGIPTKPGLVPNEIEYPLLNQVEEGTKGDLVGVLNQVSSNNTHKNNTQPTTTTGGDDGDFLKTLIRDFDISSKRAREIVATGADPETVYQSIRNCVNPKEPHSMGRFILKLIDAPPLPGKPYDGPYGKPTAQNGTGPRQPKPDTLTPAQLAERIRGGHYDQ